MITGNTVSSNQRGIDVGVAADATIEGNTITGGLAGLFLASDAVLAEGNTITGARTASSWRATPRPRSRATPCATTRPTFASTKAIRRRSRATRSAHPTPRHRRAARASPYDGAPHSIIVLFVDIGRPPRPTSIHPMAAGFYTYRTRSGLAWSDLARWTRIAVVRTLGGRVARVARSGAARAPPGRQAPGRSRVARRSRALPGRQGAAERRPEL